MFDFSKRGIMLHSRPYSIKDENTGEINEGVSIKFLPVEDLTPKCDSINRDVRGTNTAKSILPLKLLHKVEEVPAMYNLHYKVDVGSDGKAVLKAVDIDFLHTIEFAPVVPEKSSK